MDNKNKTDIIAQEARKTYNAIKVLRKTMPHFTRSEKDALEKEIKKLQDQWWSDVQDYFIKN